MVKKKPWVAAGAALVVLGVAGCGTTQPAANTANQNAPRTSTANGFGAGAVGAN